jgi:hypothetical protein
MPWLQGPILLGSFGIGGRKCRITGGLEIEDTDFVCHRFKYDPWICSIAATDTDLIICS